MCALRPRAGYGMTRRELPPANVYLEPTREPELPADAKARKEQQRGAVTASRA